MYHESAYMTSQQQQQYRSPFSEAVRTFVPGISQGATTVLLGHPLDTAKTRMQAVGPHVKSSVFQTMLHIARHEGIKGLYRGAAPPILMEGAKRGVQFALWDVFRSHSTESETMIRESERISANGLSSSNSSAGGGMPVSSVQDQVVAPKSGIKRVLGIIGSSTFLSGSIAGGIGTLMGCPMHVIKIQTQNQTAGGTKNAWTCTTDIWHREGFKGFYRGLKANMLKDVCFSGTYLSLYTYFKGQFHIVKTSVLSRGTDLAQNQAGSESINGATTVMSGTGSVSTIHTTTTTTNTTHGGNDALETFLSGSVACMITWILLYPLDTMKTLIQSKRLPSISAVSAAHMPFREVYRGMTASLWRAGPIAGIAMLVYEKSKTALQ